MFQGILVFGNWVYGTYCDEYFFPYKIEGSFPGPQREGSNIHKKKPSESKEVKIENQVERNHPQVTQMAAGSRAAGLHRGQLEDFSNDVHRCNKSRNKTANFSAVEKSS